MKENGPGEGCKRRKGLRGREYIRQSRVAVEMGGGACGQVVGEGREGGVLGKRERTQTSWGAADPGKSRFV